MRFRNFLGLCLAWGSLTALALPQIQSRSPAKGPVPVNPQAVLSGRFTGLHMAFEELIENPKQYADPFRDVTLNLTVRRPSGREFRFWGFYDGDQIWRFRILPDEPGRWHYVAEFSDGSIRKEADFNVVYRPNAKGMLSVHKANPVWFGRSSGEPVLIRGLHVGDRFFAGNWPAADREHFLRWIASNGYNLLSVASHYLNRDEPGRGQGWQTPRLWPLNPGEYRKMEAILTDLEKRGVFVWPFAGFFGQDSNYPRDPQDQEAYIRYTLARLAAYPHVLWNVAGPEPNLKGEQEWMPSQEVVRLGRLIKSLDPFQHPISVHNRTGDDPYRDSDWTDYGILQGPKTNDPAKLSEGLLRNHHPHKPLLAQETLWSRNTFHTRSIGRDYTDDEIRQNAWILELSAASLVFADNNGNSSTGFTGTLNPAEAHPTRHRILNEVWDFMETLPFGEMSPRQDLVDNGYCLAVPGKAILVYLPSGGPLTLRPEARAEGLSAAWVDSRQLDKRIPVALPPDGKLTSPDGGPWLLLLR